MDIGASTERLLKLAATAILIAGISADSIKVKIIVKPKRFKPTRANRVEASYKPLKDLMDSDKGLLPPLVKGSKLRIVIHFDVDDDSVATIVSNYAYTMFTGLIPVLGFTHSTLNSEHGLKIVATRTILDFDK